jgi:hypothetical protein
MPLKPRPKRMSHSSAGIEPEKKPVLCNFSSSPVAEVLGGMDGNKLGT